MIEWVAVKAFAKAIPWQVWLAAALLAIVPTTYCKGRSDGKEVAYSKLEKAQAEAKAQADRDRQSADVAAQKRAAENDAAIQQMEEAIEHAKATDTNALDAIF